MARSRRITHFDRAFRFFPVVDDAGAVVSDGAATDVAIVADVMVPAVTFRERDDVRTAALGLVSSDVRAAPVLDDTGKIVGMIDQHDIVRALTAASISGSST